MAVQISADFVDIQKFIVFRLLIVTLETEKTIEKKSIEIIILTDE